MKKIFGSLSKWWNQSFKDDVSAWPEPNHQEMLDDELDELESQRDEILEKLKNSHITHSDMNDLLDQLRELNKVIEGRILLKRMS